VTDYYIVSDGSNQIIGSIFVINYLEIL